MKHSLTQLFKALAILVLLTAACASLNPQQPISPTVDDTFPSSRTTNGDVAAEVDLTAAPLCTPPACAPGEGYACPIGVIAAAAAARSVRPHACYARYAARDRPGNLKAGYGAHCGAATESGGPCALRCNNRACSTT